MRDSSQQISVLFVCLGNICRSPMAEGVFRQVVADAGLSHRFRIDSSGTGSWHVGRPPDIRAQQALAVRGIDISNQRARQFTRDDFKAFDLILAMDRSNYDRLHALAPDVYEPNIRLFMKYAPEMGACEIPDPFFGGPEGFDYVLNLIEVASRGLLASVIKEESMLAEPYARSG
ncbi:MAG: low molecular weight protein-tyrosine-phosphatase [Dichotomicrobium sp.]